MDKIIDNLYVGPYEAALNKQLVEQHGIKLIVNCTKSNTFLQSVPLNQLSVPIDDPPLAADQLYLMNNYPTIASSIEFIISGGGSVLIHCAHGIQRSPTVAAIYLMVKYGLTYENAILFVRSKRQNAFANGINFHKTLEHVQLQMEQLKMLKSYQQQQMNMNLVKQYEDASRLMENPVLPDIGPETLENIILFDIDEEFIADAKKLEQYGIRTIRADVNELIMQEKIDAIISPANGFGFMDGGINKIYTKLFQGIQQSVQFMIRKLGSATRLGKAYLPIGSAITIPTRHPRCPLLVCAPIMFYPGNIKNTDNIIYTFLAIIYLAKTNPDKIYAVPSLGVEIGQLSPRYVVDQMEQAITKYTSIQNSNYMRLIKGKDQNNILLHKIPCQQPNSHSNQEIPL